MKVPWTLLGYIAAGLLVLAGLNHAAGFIPFTPQWSAKQAKVQVGNLKGEVTALQATVTGNAEIGQATDTYHTQTVVVREITAEAQAEARNAPDADTPLSDERASRLRAADERLCVASGLCATSAPDAS